MWRYELHPPHLITVATLPTTLCKSKHRKCNSTTGYYQRKLHQMYHSVIKVDQGHHVPEIYLYVCYTAKRAWNKDSWHQRPAKTLDANLLFWLWPEHHRCWRDHLRSCVHDSIWHFERMLWHKCLFMWFIRTFYDTVNVVWCTYQLFCS